MYEPIIKTLLPRLHPASSALKKTADEGHDLTKRPSLWSHSIKESVKQLEHSSKWKDSTGSRYTVPINFQIADEGIIDHALQFLKRHSTRTSGKNNDLEYLLLLATGREQVLRQSDIKSRPKMMRYESIPSRSTATQLHCTHSSILHTITYISNLTINTTCRKPIVVLPCFISHEEVGPAFKRFVERASATPYADLIHTDKESGAVYIVAPSNSKDANQLPAMHACLPTDWMIGCLCDSPCNVAPPVS